MKLIRETAEASEIVTSNRTGHIADQITPLRDLKLNAKSKILKDEMRFRTCCVDPRASK